MEHGVAGLKMLLPLIQNMKVKIALEPHFRSAYHDAKDFDFIFQHVDHPQLGATVDTGHFHVAGVDMKTFVRAYASKISNVHL